MIREGWQRSFRVGDEVESGDCLRNLKGHDSERRHHGRDLKIQLLVRKEKQGRDSHTIDNFLEHMTHLNFITPSACRPPFTHIVWDRSSLTIVGLRRPRIKQIKVSQIDSSSQRECMYIPCSAALHTCWGLQDGGDPYHCWVRGPSSSCVGDTASVFALFTGLIMNMS